MTPKSFDLTTCKEVIGDERLRIVEAKARADAENGIFAPIPHSFTTHWGKVREDMEDIVYGAAHKKRIKRLERQATRAPSAINSGVKK